MTSVGAISEGEKLDREYEWQKSESNYWSLSSVEHLAVAVAIYTAHHYFKHHLLVCAWNSLSYLTLVALRGAWAKRRVRKLEAQMRANALRAPELQKQVTELGSQNATLEAENKALKDEKAQAEAKAKREAKEKREAEYEALLAFNEAAEAALKAQKDALAEHQKSQRLAQMITETLEQRESNKYFRATPLVLPPGGPL